MSKLTIDEQYSGLLLPLLYLAEDDIQTQYPINEFQDDVDWTQDEDEIEDAYYEFIHEEVSRTNGIMWARYQPHLINTFPHNPYETTHVSTRTERLFAIYRNGVENKEKVLKLLAPRLANLAW